MTEGRPRGSSGSRRRKLDAAAAATRAREQLEQLLGRQVETISSLSRNGTQGWVVAVEVVELERIPESTSLLGSYEVKLDGDGDLVEARRIRRYSRNQVDSQSKEEE
ncbi:MAG TPA: gas vesicle protein GvpO [Gaiellaceae bacterium]